MVVVNQDGRIVLLNVQAEKQFGIAATSSSGRRSRTSFPKGLRSDDRRRTRTATDALEQQIGTGIELSGLRKDGSEFPIEIMLSPWRATRRPCNGGHSQHQCASGGGRPPGANGGPIPGSPGGGSRCDGRGEPGGRSCC
jgi:PAS domain S-box-containing protein